MSRWPVRLRLAVMHGVMFLVLGVTLLGANFFMVRSELSPRIEQVVTDVMAPGAVTRAPEQAPAPGLGARIDSITVNTLLTRSGIALAGASLLVGMFSWWIAGRSLRPIRRITSVAQGLSDRTLHQRIDLTGPADEIKDLADTFDGMLGRLDESFDGQRRFVANASHELRTPLTIARTALDVYQAKHDPSRLDVDTAMAKVGHAVARSERLLDSLLTLARAEHPDRIEDVDLSALVAGVISEHDGTRVESSIEPALLTRGDPTLLERMVANLIDNALRHGDRGTVRTQVEGDGESVSIIVENGGLWIDHARVADLFKPFVRLDQDRISSASGSGLGLSIVDAIARAHGGSVEAHPRNNGGLRVAVTLPALTSR